MKVAASCLWLASKLEESPRKARQVLIVFHKKECRMENLQIKHLEIGSQKYYDLKTDLSRTKRNILKEIGFVCHVEHPHKFTSNYLAICEAQLSIFHPPPSSNTDRDKRHDRRHVRKEWMIEI
ncbi:hypothetical protein SO802_009599 [Lithocarpus litseifolius]|uniref:Uncharacterized protein n=1 Tax=Lithocarpus litseifolius TaxID=425828 RepID=A0AAW2DCE4_9ROSI